MMRRNALVLVAACVLAAYALAFAQQVSRTSSAESSGAKSITVGVRPASQSGQSSGTYATEGGMSYSVQVTDDAGNTISAPVSVVVNLPRTHESVGNRWNETAELAPEDALPAARWGVLVPLPRDFEQAPPRSAAQLGGERSTAPVPLLANIVYSYDTPEISGQEPSDRSQRWYVQDTVTTFYSISCAEFRPIDSGQTFKCGPWELMPTNVIGSNAFIAPVHLPDGAEVAEVRVWVYDSHGRNDLLASLDAVRLDEIGPSYTMAEVMSGGQNGIQELVSYGVQYSSVNNSAFKYTLTVSGFSGTAHHRLLGARIQYETVVGGEPVPQQAVRGW
jgi:hypothetical protein